MTKADLFPAWLSENVEDSRPTEILAPIEIAVGPVWDHTRQVGGWSGRLYTVPSPIGDAIWDCDHVHVDKDDAWRCVESLAQEFAKLVLHERHRHGGDHD